MKNDEIIRINGQILPVREHQGQRVVTMKDIAVVHQTNESKLRSNFKNNKKHFIDQADYFHLKGKSLVQNLDVGENTTQINIFTESGYLMLVKSLTDDLSWKVQRELVNGYFRLSPALSNGEGAVVKSELGRLRQNLLESGARDAVLAMLPAEYKTLLRYSQMKLSESETAILMKLSATEIKRMQQSLKMAGLLQGTPSLPGKAGVMLCKKCGHYNSYVVSSRKTADGVIRIRSCRQCRHTFETIEKPVEVQS